MSLWRKVTDLMLRRPRPDDERTGKARDIAAVKSQSDATLVRVGRILDKPGSLDSFRRIGPLHR